MNYFVIFAIMDKLGSTFVIFFLLLNISTNIYATDDACSNQIFLNSLDENIVHVKNLTTKDCSEIYFEVNEKLNSHLGSVSVKAIENDKNFSLNISFLDIKWKKAHVRLSELNKPEKNICKVYFTEDRVKFPITEVYDLCFNLYNYNESVDYKLDFKAELNTDILYKEILFKLPPFESFENTVPLPKRTIFTSVDASSNYEIILTIQKLPTFYNVSYYKVELFKEKDNSNILLDVRMLPAGLGDTEQYVYVTYNEEGHYFFKVSAIDDDLCLEDVCLKSVSPRIFIKRKYPPLVIGIVGASFIIPCFLFIFHMWTRKNHLRQQTESKKDKVYIVYSQTPEKHYVIVKTLETTLKSLTNVQIVSNITEATHIIYICGTHIFEPDAGTHKYLVVEANKEIAELEIYVVSFPYSSKEIPPYLKKCLRFDLMDDFGKLIHIFNCDVEYENNSHYLQLRSEVKDALTHTEAKKIILNMPKIIITEQSDSSDTEPKEADVLL